MDEVYRGYRIVCRNVEGQWTARVYEARGNLLPLRAQCSESDGVAVCALRAKAVVDSYLLYLGGRSG